MIKILNVSMIRSVKNIKNVFVRIPSALCNVLKVTTTCHFQTSSAVGGRCLCAVGRPVHGRV